MRRSWAILAAACVLLACVGCTGPMTGQHRHFAYYYPDGEAWIIEVTVGHMYRIPVLDRPPAKPLPPPE